MYLMDRMLSLPKSSQIVQHSPFQADSEPPVSQYLIDEAVCFEGDPSQGEVELVHALLQCEQIAIHRDLHDGLSVDLDHQAPPLLLHRDLT